MKKIIEYLEQLDFSENEAKIYLTLIRKGTMSVYEVSKETKINRTAVYSYINKLLEKGVLAKSKGISGKIFANPPERIQYLVEEKIAKANNLKEELFPIVTMLNTTYMKNSNSKDHDVKYYKGRSGVRAIYNDCLKSNYLRTYFNCDEIEEIFPENFELFRAAMEKNSKMLLFEFLESSDLAIDQMKKYKVRLNQRYSYKYLPTDVKLTANDILIYDGKVAIINVGDKSNIEGVVVENQYYFNNSAQIFDLLWRLLPEPQLSSK